MKELTLNDIPLEMVYRYVYEQTRKVDEEPVFNSKMDGEIVSMSYDGTIVCRKEDKDYIVTIPGFTDGMAVLLDLLSRVEILKQRVLPDLERLYKPYHDVLELQLRIDKILKSDLFFAPFDVEDTITFVNPAVSFTKAAKNGAYDTLTDEEYYEKFDEMSLISKECFCENRDYTVLKRGRVLDIHRHLYALCHLLPSVTAKEAQEMRLLLVNYPKDAVVFMMYSLEREWETFEDRAWHKYLWYFVNQDSRYKSMAKAIQRNYRYESLRIMEPDTTLQMFVDIFHHVEAKDLLNLEEFDLTYSFYEWLICDDVDECVEGDWVYGVPVLETPAELMKQSSPFVIEDEVAEDDIPIAVDEGMKSEDKPKSISSLEELIAYQQAMQKKDFCEEKS